MQTIFNEQQYSQTVIFEGFAEVQILLGSLLAYKNHYASIHWDNELSKFKESYNENHANLIESIYDRVSQEYITPSPVIRKVSVLDSLNVEFTITEDGVGNYNKELSEEDLSTIISLLEIAIEDEGLDYGSDMVDIWDEDKKEATINWKIVSNVAKSN